MSPEATIWLGVALIGGILLVAFGVRFFLDWRNAQPQPECTEHCFCIFDPVFPPTVRCHKCSEVRQVRMR